MTSAPPASPPTARTARPVVLAVGLVALFAACVASVAVGSRAVPLGELWRALADFDPLSGDHLVVRDIRLPRTLLGVAVGAALAVGGALIQTLSRNPLAEPGILGVTHGAGFALTVGAALGLAGSTVSQLGLGVVGSVLATALVYAVGRHSTLRLLLAGVAFSAVLMGVSLGIRLMSPDTLDKYRFWSVGSLAGREQTDLTVPLVAIGVALVGALVIARSLNAVALGDTVAHTLGANVARVRTLTLVLITVLAGAATAVAGPILFVGLIVPHLLRRLTVGSVPWLVGLSAVVGPVLMLVADTIARVLLDTGEVPVAIVTAFLGGPMLIWVVRRYGAGSL
ncbi:MULTISPECIES: FecCD family ABC transporter permease [Prauserella salsuginis group]|uniref:Iron complex transport system permease protein n=2 Tax=Prauserella salsuginis group TaxID=2893672 RepID=A0A839XHK0_9PSEU|nr:iron complex transport system permease protein [Prauserella sediminis]MCR3722677.1 iron complex transport system permease protein [Prauserella flava]MCR3737268.1 iron complex transport system permease protein [Prauserella salsuginis]